MVTQMREQKATAKQNQKPPPKLGGARHKANGEGKIHHAAAQDGRFNVAENAQFTEQIGPPAAGRERDVQKNQQSGLVARGRDLLAGEAGSIAGAAAIVIGAALIEVELIPGLVIGVGAVLLGKLFPELGSYVRPAIKGAVRAGFSMSQKAREVVAEATEQVHDLVAEVKHEHEKPQTHTASRTVKATVVAGNELPVH